MFYSCYHDKCENKLEAPLFRCWLNCISCFSCSSDPGFSSSIIEGPSNLTALVGTEAHFNCTVSEGWQILIWLFEGQPVLSVTYPGKVIVTDKSYSQQGYDKSTEFTSELIIYGVQLNNSGRIECSIQTMGGNQYAFLSVQGGCMFSSSFSLCIVFPPKKLCGLTARIVPIPCRYYFFSPPPLRILKKSCSIKTNRIFLA